MQSILTKYECSICQNIFTQPYEIKCCSHTFCKTCIESTLEHCKTSYYQCPLCKKQFKKSDLETNKNLEKEIKEISTVCICGVSIKLNKYNEHITECKQHSAVISTNVKKSVFQDAKQTVNRSTFNCSVCKERNLDREGLLKHVQKSHRNDEAVCPICVCQPWGDPYYITHLHGHLQKRHKFDYDTTVQYNEDEDEVLKKVLQESMNYK